VATTGKKSAPNRAPLHTSPLGEQAGCPPGTKTTPAAASSAAAGVVEEADDDFIDFCGLGGPLESSLPGEEAVSRALTQHEARDIGIEGVLLLEKEDDVIRSNTTFGVELARLRVLDPAPIAQSRLVLPTFLTELSLSTCPVQSAHLYWGLSRGLRFLPRGHKRAPTKSANYYKAEHRHVVLKEFARLAASGFTRPADEIDVVDCLAVGCVVKADGKVRCVVNASAPISRSINDDIQAFGVVFPRLQQAGEAMTRGCYAWKFDVSDYYLCFPLRACQYPHTVVEIEGKLIYYAFMCFGIRNAVRLCQGISVRLTEILWRKLRVAGVPDENCLGLFEYLDDWLGLHDGADGGAGARTSFRCCLSLFRSLGMPFDVIKAGKVVPPSNVGLTYLGVYLNCQHLRYELTADRIASAQEVLRAFLRLDVVSLLGVQQLHGLLSFLCVALPVGSHLLFHLRRLMSVGLTASTSRARQRKHAQRLRVHGALRADLEIFSLVLELFNGRDICGTARRRHIPFNIESDASIYGGCAWMGGHHIIRQWDYVHASADMCTLEARMVRIALEQWAPCFASSVVHITVDNEGVYHLLGGGTVQRSAELQAEFVRIIMLQLQYDVVIVPHWLAGELNVLPDAGSRVFETNPATAQKYRAKFNALVAAWFCKHGAQRWHMQRSRRVPRPEAAALWERWCALTDGLLPQAGVKRKCRSI
jgi:hypothetical protein